MVTFLEMQNDFNDIIRNYGCKVRFRYFARSGTESGVSVVYDDDLTLVQSGSDLWTSGVVQPFGNSSSDAFLKQQGMVLQDDTKLYTYASVSTSGLWRVGVGSPVSREYSNFSNGGESWEVQGNVVLKRLHLRYLTTGSLSSE